MEPRDLALIGAGLMGAGVALVHGVLTRRFITRPIREIGTEALRPQILRLTVMLLDFSTFSWFIGGLALVAAPWMSPEARGVTAFLVGSAYLYAVVGNAWATRGRHPGWMLYAICLALIAYGARAPAARTEVTGGRESQVGRASAVDARDGFSIISPMARLLSTAAVVGLLATAVPLSASAGPAPAPRGAIEIRTDDVTRFYRLYDGAGGRPSAEQIQRDYLDVGTPGLRHLTRVRNVTAAGIARATETQPQLYENARSCLAALPRVRSRLDRAFAALLELYPEAARPPVTILVSRGRPLAIAGPGSGVQVAVEAICSDTAVKVLGADVDDRFVRVIAHEYVHVQQAPEREAPTVLQRALPEGVAEFVGELISGRVANAAVHASARGREEEIERRFAADLHKTDLSAWFDNTTAEDPGQLGYWVGYRIAKSYYLNAPDKRLAVREMMQVTDAEAFLARSGWRPGAALGATPAAPQTSAGRAR